MTHLHVYSYAVDCDGPIEQTYVDWTRGLSEWIGDQITMAFARGNPEPHVSGEYDLRATISYATDEGGVTVEAVVCEDDCPDTTTYRDIRAEQAGY